MLEFDGMGCFDDKLLESTDIDNYRIRTILKNKDDRYIFFEGSLAHRFDRKNTKLDVDDYNLYYPFENYLYVDFCFYLDNPQDFANNRTPGFRHLKGPHTKVKYGKKDILNFINKNLDCDYTGIQISKIRQVQDNIDKLGFYEDYEKNIIINPNNLNIKI